jgi:hypothetical protein
VIEEDPLNRLLVLYDHEGSLNECIHALNLVEYTVKKCSEKSMQDAQSVNYYNKDEKDQLKSTCSYLKTTVALFNKDAVKLLDNFHNVGDELKRQVSIMENLVEEGTEDASKIRDALSLISNLRKNNTAQYFCPFPSATQNLMKTGALVDVIEGDAKVYKEDLNILTAMERCVVYVQEIESMVQGFNPLSNEQGAFKTFLENMNQSCANVKALLEAITKYFHNFSSRMKEMTGLIVRVMQIFNNEAYDSRHDLKSTLDNIKKIVHFSDKFL